MFGFFKKKKLSKKYEGYEYKGKPITEDMEAKVDYSISFSNLAKFITENEINTQQYENWGSFNDENGMLKGIVSEYSVDKLIELEDTLLTLVRLTADVLATELTAANSITKATQMLLRGANKWHEAIIDRLEDINNVGEEPIDAPRLERDVPKWWVEVERIRFNLGTHCETNVTYEDSEGYTYRYINGERDDYYNERVNGITRI